MHLHTVRTVYMCSSTSLYNPATLGPRNLLKLERWPEKVDSFQKIYVCVTFGTKQYGRFRQCDQFIETLGLEKLHCIVCGRVVYCLQMCACVHFCTSFCVVFS